MKKINHELLNQITHGAKKGENRELFIKIYKNSIEVVFGYARIKKVTKVNSYNNRLYYIPTELFNIFENSYIEYQTTLSQQIQEDVNAIKQQPLKDWHDDLQIIKLQTHIELIDKRDTDSIVTDYITDRIYHKAIPEIYQYFEKDRARIVMISESINKQVPGLKKIIDTMVIDITNSFEIIPKAKIKKLNGKNIDKGLHDIGYSDDIIEEMDYSDKQSIKDKLNNVIAIDPSSQKISFSSLLHKEHDLFTIHEKK